MKRTSAEAPSPQYEDDGAIFGSRRLSSILNPASLSFALIGLLITTFAASALYHAQKEALGVRFRSETESTHRLLTERFDSITQILQTGSALLHATNEVSEEQWRAFFHSQELTSKFPGFMGIGFAMVAPSASRSATDPAPPANEPRNLQNPDLGGESPYAPIVLYKNLGTPENHLPIGGDLMSGQSRGDAIVAARDSGKCAIEFDPDFSGPEAPAFLFVSPVYTKGADISSVALRRAAIRGYVFGPLRADALTDGIVDGEVGMRIVDSEALPGSLPIFESIGKNGSPTFQDASEVRLGDHFWRIETFSLAPFENRKQRLSSLFIALSGVAITLLGMMILSDARAKQEKIARIAKRTAESLKVSEAEVRSMNAGLEEAIATRTAWLEEANEELRTFSYTVSHDLRAPARHVQALAGFLSEEHGGELSDGARDYLSKIEGSAMRMQSLIEDILRLASCSNTPVHPRRVDFTALAYELFASFRCQHPGRTIREEIEPGMEMVGDPSVLRTTLQNLLENAFKFTAPREVASISVGTAGGASEQGGKTWFFVKDNGVGFDMANAETIFQPFKRLHRQSDFEGTGVGLATVRKVIRRHGGEIWVESQEGIGTTFYFSLGTPEEDTETASRETHPTASAGHHSTTPKSLDRPIGLESPCPCP